MPHASLGPLLGLAVLSLAPGAAAARPQEADGEADADADAVKSPLSMSAQELVLLPGDYDVEVADVSLAAGTAVGLELALQTYVLSGVDLGAQVMLLRRDSDDPQLSESRLVHLGAHAGPQLQLSNGLQLALVALVGYHALSFDDAQTTSHGFGLGAAAGLMCRLVPWVWLRAQAGLLAQPVGGHAATQVTMPPTVFFGLGFALVPPGPRPSQ